MWKKIKNVGLYFSVLISFFSLCKYILDISYYFRGPDFRITMMPPDEWRDGKKILTISNWNSHAPVKSDYSVDAHYYYILSKINISASIDHSSDHDSNNGIPMYDLDDATHVNYGNVSGTGLLGSTFYKGPTMNYSKYRFIHSKVRLGNKLYKRKADEELSVVAYVRVRSGEKSYFYLIQPDSEKKVISEQDYRIIVNNPRNDLGGAIGYYADGVRKYSTFPKFYSGNTNFFETARKYIIRENMQAISYLQ
ncbi:hypothetical protein ABC418_13840 [Lactiplantibacillus plantarum]|uniref:hypothetical protein n=1 Tax=Lactiplantibacillus plantarum TaxID=1590 RepID=UPI003965A4D3